MTGFLIRRVLTGLLVLWLISVAVFVLFFVAPHDVATSVAGSQASPAEITLISHRLGLDRPLVDQYGSFLWGLLHGNLGYSYFYSASVSSLILHRVGVTASLAIGGAVLALVFGVIPGVWAASRPRSLADRGTSAGVLAFHSMPAFLVGILLFYVMFYWLHEIGFPIFPGSGYVSLLHSPLGWASHLILPWLAIAIPSAAGFARLTRTSMLEVLGEDYIRVARAKGAGSRRVLWIHALRSASTPVVTHFSVELGQLLGGAVLVETIFGLPGIGQLAVEAINDQDRPVIMGCALVAAVVVVVANIATDLLYPVIDPRVRAH